MEKVIIIIAGIFVTLVVLMFSALIIGLPIMWLWDWLMPTLFGLSTITFWQSVGLSLLSSLLFKSSSSSSKE